MGKRVSLEKVTEIVSWCHQIGLLTNGMFVIGIPGETKETIDQSMQYAIHAGFDGISVAIATPFPGTQLYADCLQKGYLKPRNVGYYNLRESLIETPSLSGEEAKAMQVVFLEEFSKRYRGKVPYELVKEYMRYPNDKIWDKVRPHLERGISR